MRKRVIALFIATVTLFGTALAQDLVVTVTFDGGGWFDRSFNEGTWSGLTRAVQELSGETAVDVLIYNGSADTTVTALRRMAATRLDLVVAAGFLQADAINTVSGEFPTPASCSSTRWPRPGPTCAACSSRTRRVRTSWVTWPAP